MIELETSYLFVFQKGNNDFFPIERHARNDEEIIEIKTFFEGRSDRGSIKTELIGPASNWSNLLWETSEQEARDSISVDVFGVNETGEETILYEKLLDKNVDLTSISAIQYPYLKLNWNTKDQVNLTPSQLDYWRVLYEPFPE